MIGYRFGFDALCFLVIVALSASIALYTCTVKIGVYVPMPGRLLSQGIPETISSPTHGTISHVHITEGQSVRLNQPLFTLRSDPNRTRQALIRRHSELLEQFQSMQGLPKDDDPAMRNDRVLKDSRREISEAISLLDARIANADEETVVRANRKGRAIDIKANVGDDVEPGRRLAVVVDAKPQFRVLAYAPSHRIGQVSEGSMVRLSVDASGSREPLRLSGRVRSVSKLPLQPGEIGLSSSGAEPQYEVTIHLDDTSARNATSRDLAPGSAVTAEVLVGDRTLLGWIFTRFE